VGISGDAPWSHGASDSGVMLISTSSTIRRVIAANVTLLTTYNLNFSSNDSRCCPRPYITLFPIHCSLKKFDAVLTSISQSEQKSLVIIFAYLRFKLMTIMNSLDPIFHLFSAIRNVKTSANQPFPKRTSSRHTRFKNLKAQKESYWSSSPWET
jgi:hypothetical protein